MARTVLEINFTPPTSKAVFGLAAALYLTGLRRLSRRFFLAFCRIEVDRG